MDKETLQIMKGQSDLENQFESSSSSLRANYIPMKEKFESASQIKIFLKLGE